MRILHYSDLENAYDDPERIGRVAGLIAARRDEETLIAGTGDNTGPGVLSLVENGRQALEFFDAVEPAVDTFGNHDFDHGYDELRGIVRESPQEWVSANVRYRGGRFGTASGAVPWTIVRKGGYDVGITGVTTPKTPSITPPASDLTVTDPIAAVAEATDALRDGGADLVVVLAHLADDEEIALACDVDVVLGGHVHSERIERIDGTVLTRPAANGVGLYEIEIDSARHPTVTRHAVEDAPIDEDVASTLRERNRRANLDTVVDTVDHPVKRTNETTLRGESRIGNFVADAYRWATGADVGLQNSGGIRAGSPLVGEVTVGELISVVPFEEALIVAELSGSELRDLCWEASGRQIDLGEPDWWHAHVSGAEIVWDRGVDELNEVLVDGSLVDPDGTYTLATSKYLAITDHEFPTLEEDHVVSEGAPQYDVLVEYARSVGIDPSLDGRIHRIDSDSPYASGPIGTQSDE